MNHTLRQIFLGVVVALLLTAGATAEAQPGQYRNADRRLGPTLRQIESGTLAFRTSLGTRTDQVRPVGVRSDDNINAFVSDFELATIRFRQRYDQQRADAADAQDVIDRASVIDGFMRHRQLDSRTERDWANLRVSLDQFAGAYHVSWRPDAWVNARRNGQGGYGTDRLTGTYRLDVARSDRPEDVVARLTRGQGAGDQRLRIGLTRRLTAPDMLAIERRGRTITMTSSRAAPVTFEADGHDQIEQNRRGGSMRTMATLFGDQLTVDSTGDRASDYQVTFAPADNGRGLRVTRRISDERLTEPALVNSYYSRTSDVAQADIYTGRDDRSYPVRDTAPGGEVYVPDGTQLTALLNDSLSTRQARPEDRFTMSVRAPGQYDGATLEGHLGSVNRSGRIAGRADMSFQFDRIRLRDGRTMEFDGDIDSVRTPDGDTIRIDNEGRARDDSQTGRTVARTGIGAAIGAVIGAIVGGSEGAAIGGVVGAGAGAGSVYVQGRDDLDLPGGTEFLVRARASR